MYAFLIEHAVRTSAFVVMVVASVAGPSYANVEAEGIVFSSPHVHGFSFGGIAFVDSGSPWVVSRQHEVGHLRHEHEIGVIPYIVVAGVTSGVLHLLGAAKIVNYKDYLSTWTERTAEEYGKEIR